ncbi:TrbI F-type domain-containing protein [Sphingomonas sp. ID1715]|uniref:TrbI F-type domain-containing protein n=1 Tax=Sphingomonas sp. ID1715 TaxID=1656898 RepID=UPI001489E239|nr:TrbI F-type domain-containing protein [Sphingomonas sp. ID1715]NNM77682.1 TrbI F-type domain-containing protein [Sphingomonas sp. ID1715]
MSERPSASPTRTIAGWPAGRVIGAAFLAANTLWGAWATKTLIELEQRQIMTVGLNGLVSDFITAESRRATTPEQAALRTRSYLAALDQAVGELERDGSVVLVRESVLGHGVTDRTGQVRARVERLMEAGHDPR